MSVRGIRPGFWEGFWGVFDDYGGLLLRGVVQPKEEKRREKNKGKGLCLMDH